MAFLNSQQLIGNVGRVEELRQAGSTPVLNFTLGQTSPFDKTKTTRWYKVAIFGKQAEALSRFLAPGALVYTEGQSDTIETYEDKKTGETRFSERHRANSVQVLSSKNSGDGGGSSAPSTSDYDDSDVPF
jgi:single stranded DNA-binding protein